MSDRPVIALDFDGVLNVFPLGTPPAGFTTHQIDISHDQWPASPFLEPHPGPGRPFAATVIVNASRDRQTVEGWLAAGGEVVWATLWQEAAAAVLNPLFGFDLPVAVSTSVTPPRWGEIDDPIGWKTRVLDDRFPGRAKLLLDDNANPGRHALHGRGSQVIRVDPRRGLDPQRILPRVNAWIAANVR